MGTELDRLLDEERWRALVRRVRAVTDARLTYAANWDTFEDVPFWDALDAVGIQAYFPLVDEADEGEAVDVARLERGWVDVLDDLRALHRSTGKPVVFTELGYTFSPYAASRPWEDAPRGGSEDEAQARALQERCLRVGLRVLDRERAWLRGAFLWKWFVGEPHYGDADFHLDTPRLREALREEWRRSD